MARLGIDYGTTNTVVVSSDRGRFPVVPHVTQTAVGPVAREVYPSLVVVDRDSGRFLFGAEAERALLRPGAEERYGVIRSLKRLLGGYVDGLRVGTDVVPGGFDPCVVLAAFLGEVRASVARSGLFPADEPLEAVITWPANAGGAQRYVTRRCFKDAGFTVVNTLNEPSAAAIEFADRLARGDRGAARRLRMTVGVFDLGGGTFDASLLRVDGSEFTVLDCQGIERLGGDDFDEQLALLFAEKLGLEFPALRPFQRNLLLMHARQQKESIGDGAVRSLSLFPADLGLAGTVCRVSVEEYFERVQALLDPAMGKVAELFSGEAAADAGLDVSGLDAIYLVGGASKLPLVTRRLAECFPDVKVVVSDKPFTATAMGAAIRSGQDVRMHDILSRTFGVLRLADHSRRECFAPVFPAGTRLPAQGEPPLECDCRYAPHHNIGHLRYLECAAVDEDGMPSEGLRTWSDVLFPYDPNLPVGADLSPDAIEFRPDLQDRPVTETYRCDADGVITVRITRWCDGQSRTCEVFRGR